MYLILPLDRILSSASFFTTKWSQGIESNKARRVLHYLLCRLYDTGKGNLVNAELTFAQTSLALKLGISRQWIGVLVARLEATGWLEHHSPKLADGTNTSTVWRAGRMLKRLLVMLSKSRQRKLPIKSDAKSTWHFSPLRREKEILSILTKENALPTPQMLDKMPLLKKWMERGKTP